MDILVRYWQALVCKGQSRHDIDSVEHASSTSI